MTMHGGDNSQVERIEAEKLKAVGLRNKVAALEEVRIHTPCWLHVCAP